MEIKILYEDNHIIAVYKSAGVLVQGDISGDPNLLDGVKEFIKRRDQKPGNVFLGLVHRLDRPVSGIVIFAKTSKGASRISEQFRNGEVTKIYHAVIEGKPKKDKDTLINYLKKDEDKKISLVYDSPDKGGDYAELDYEVVRSAKDTSLLKIVLKTGRFHQIRSQLSTIGHPIVGDKKYLPAGRQVAQLKDGGIALCATEIKFKKTTSEELVHIRIDYPKEWSELL